jgi:hypothetical protein
VSARALALLLAAAAAAPAGAKQEQCPLPKHWGAYTSPADIPAGSLVNVIRLEGKGKVLWNGKRVESEQVRALVDLAGKLKNSHIVFVLDQGKENCETFDYYRRIVDRSDCTEKTCMVGKGPPDAGRAPAPNPD